ncbi:putative ribonuclease H-like domain, transcription elongation factor Spt6, DNA ligase B [Medicago truncatula]|uniref:Transcription elongation factor spt6 n=1 Tax=Medicago truncatula TaxID=3880 RepID=G7L4U0_MEDTR|nr:transcription elongation factor SPT6 homolog isoform X2 [Medicago truncatula]AES81104.2 global transcription factor [Medicago truncatula]RHN47666.1 putative ribonuclease H-like domain, transcription elongation factor Spt6, DNA ligase B [Medicago truncatula]
MAKGVISDDEDEVEYGMDEREPIDGEELEEDDGRGVVDDDDEEEEEEGQDEYEKDGFIVDDIEEEEEQDDEERAESDEERRKKKKRKKKEEYVLDEDDYELLEDNNINIHRRKENKKFKRLKKGRGTEEGHSRQSDDDEFFGSGKGGRSAKEKELEYTLFDGEEGTHLEDIGEEEEQGEEEEDADIGEEDEMADFIVDEEEVDENGIPLRTRKLKGVRRFKQAPSTALQEAQALFGDVEEYLDARNRSREQTDNMETRLEDEFEPIILSEKYMTEKDDMIRELDIPERMQISEESTGAPDGSSINEETQWIVKQLKHGAVPWIRKKDSSSQNKEQELPINQGDIVRFLELHHGQSLDIPFIAMYRKEECLSLLKDLERPEAGDENWDKNNKTPILKWHKILWALHDLDRKWLLLQKRKSALQLYYNKRFEEESRRVYDETRLNLNRQLFESVMRSLKEAESEREVDDVDSKFNVHFPPGEAGVDEGQYKRPKRKSMYSTFSKAGLWEVASRFGCSSEQLGLCLSLVQLQELEDPKETPEEVASNFTCAMYDTPEEVLKCARHMAAVEISCEPSIKKYVRSHFIDHAVVSTSPTADGNITIDSFHQFSGVKWLREKPLSKFEDAQWLLIQKAEEEKLIQVTIKLPEEYLNKLIDQFNELYISDSVSRSAQLWNEQRKLILHDAFFRFLLPSMEKEARSVLASKAKHWVLMEYGKALWNKVSVGPYQQKENDLSSDDEAAPRVMACSWGPGNPQTTFVMLDSSGEVQDVLYTGSLTLRSQNANDQQRKKNDQERVLKFMTDHQPHVIVLGAANLSCTRLKEDIYEVIYKMVEENPRDVGHEMDGLSIVYGDEALPRLYENSRISSEQLPSQQLGIVRRAVALGRYLQNPLAMVTTLCGPRKEILSWKLSPLESFLNPDDKLGMIEQVLVDVTNQVGLDINLAISHEWLFAPLQFISGLGPRKAASLQRSLVRAGSIFTRKDFLTEHKLGKKVFVNAVGFLRVRRSGLAASSSQFIDLLDDTRIHPESYILAQELARAVYEEDGTADANDDDDALEMAIEHVRDRPSYLKNLEVEEYALANNREDKIETFYDIKRELIQGFQDWRKQYEEPSQDEEFYMISGETEETLAEGKIVQVTVRRVQAQKAICGLESGMTGILMKEDYTDDWRDIIELSDRLHEGDMLTCKIKSIQKNRYQVFLVCKDSEMRSDRLQNNQDLDPYYHEDQSCLPSEQDKTRKEKERAKKHFKQRMIVHPRFQNITADEAMEFLSDKDPGESIFRPSSRGPSYLTLTLKIHEGVYAHKDLVEGGKEHKDITSLLRIGKTLKIGEDTFEDLDEVMDRYVDPLVTHLKTMLNYRKFRTGTKTEVDELLKMEKAECPMRIVYTFGISHEHPGTFILTYIRSTNPHHEYIGLYPKGFRFRKKMFEDIDRLVAYFQRHIDDPQNDSAPSIRSVAAMVPMRSPATGGSSAASVGSGWGGSNGDGGWRGHLNDRDRSSTPGSRTGRPSGVPRPYGGGRGRGRGSYNNRGHNNERQDGASGWGSGWGSAATKDKDDSLSNFPGAKVQNSPGREAFPGGWGGGSGWGGGASTGDKSGWGGGANTGDKSGWGGGNGWGGGASTGAEHGNSGWGSGSKKAADIGWSGN